MSTRLLYLEDSSLTACKATILDLRQDESGVAAILSVSPFYPKGGGAGSDVGRLTGLRGRMEVRRVVTIDGEVLHWGDRIEGELRVGEDVEAVIDVEVRRRNARLHTGGEVICAAVHELGRRWPVTAAAHMPGQARVAFACNLEPEEVAEFIERLKARVAEIIQRDETVLTFLDVPESEVRSLCPLDADGLQDKKGGLRLVSPVRGFHRPCMGAHLSSTGAIGGLALRKARLRNGELSITYDLA